MIPTSTRIYDFIVQQNDKKDRSPTFREIGLAVGLASSSTVSGHIQRLVKKGLIEYIPGSPRSIVIVKPENEESITIMRRRMKIKVMEVLDDGTFKKIQIGDKNYVLDQMG